METVLKHTVSQNFSCTGKNSGTNRSSTGKISVTNVSILERLFENCFETHGFTNLSSTGQISGANRSSTGQISGTNRSSTGNCEKKEHRQKRNLTLSSAN